MSRNGIGDTTFHSRGAMRPGFCKQSTLRELRGRREDRVPFAPMVRVQKKSTRQNHRYEPEQPAFPAQWFYGLYVISPVTRLCCHRRERIVPARLTPTLGRQDHTISPSAICCSSRNTSRPSHPASNVRDDREAPLLWRRDAREHGFDLPDNATGNVHDGQFAHGGDAGHCLRRIRIVGKATACPPFRPRTRRDGGHGALRLCPPYGFRR